VLDAALLFPLLLLLLLPLSLLLLLLRGRWLSVVLR
jgi:hypothetical protein